MQQNHTPQTRLLRMPTVCEITGLSKSSITKRAAAGTFPAPVKIGERAIAWDAAKVQAWVAEKLRGGEQ